MPEIKNGDTVKDKVTGLKGVVIGKASFLTGCDQSLVSPPADGEYKDSVWVDDIRLEVDADVERIELDVNPIRPGGAPKRHNQRR